MTTTSVGGNPEDQTISSMEDDDNICRHRHHCGILRPPGTFSSGATTVTVETSMTRGANATTVRPALLHLGDSSSNYYYSDFMINNTDNNNKRRHLEEHQSFSCSIQDCQYGRTWQSHPCPQDFWNTTSDYHHRQRQSSHHKTLFRRFHLHNNSNTSLILLLCLMTLFVAPSPTVMAQTTLTIVSTTPEPPPPQLNGAHFRITALQENGFLDIFDEDTDADSFQESSHKYQVAGSTTEVAFSGYLIDMIEALSQPDRANFTYTLLPPSGMGSLCVPQITDRTNSTQRNKLYNKDYRTQYNCGASDVNDAPLRTNYSTDMYLGMYYVTPTRQLVNQFTIPFLPPFSGTLAMFGTATGIPNFQALVEQQQAGIMDPSKTCGPAGTALIDSVVQSFPGLQVRGIFGGEEEIYQAFWDQSCQVYITDGPIAAQFVLRRSRSEQCQDMAGNPIGVIGDPMHFGLSHYAIGIRRDISPDVTTTLSYWMNILMTCNPLDADGPCPDGNFATFFEGRGGTGEECGYVLYPEGPQGPGPGAIVGIVIASVAFVVIVYTLWHRYRLERQKRRYAKKSKAAMAQAQREREFNEYMAHEVRNPLASALAALSFVSSKTSDAAIVPSEEHRALIKSDVTVIDSSLQFVNELLRNMLDLHRTQTGHGIKLHMVPTDILRDIFEPVSTILFMRGAAVKIETVCPKNLFINTDRMRLKQICLNLASNSSKFVRQGYIRLRAEVVPNDNVSLGVGDLESHGKDAAGAETVILYVEDSGPGIPEEKQKQLFLKFQDSLDVLNQGTGIGLSVCKNLSQLMGGSLSLEDDFDSGVPGCPGTCFRLELNQSPLDMEQGQANTDFDGSDNMSQSCRDDLPENLSVLFVDDDLVLRKMFTRVLKMAAPTWSIQEASNGETALKVVDEQSFDVIFIDQYMASVEKQLLGTDTVRAMRAKGVESIICGLSANDMEDHFLECGANAFMSKPFPCKKEALKSEFRRMLNMSEQAATATTTTTTTTATTEQSATKEQSPL